ncbi:mannosyltransferase putative-domain-containing protein [Circinella umbellata]|nr:mannosyltransferase putative-domain-containing protein [Circinella umbellata]
MPDFTSLTTQERTFKVLFQYLDPIVAAGEIYEPQYKDVWTFYLQLERTLYPWLKPYYQNAFHLTNSTEGRGIVICIGNHQFQYAATTIRAIREVLKSTLPIEVFYIRENDLTPARRLYLETEFENLVTRQVVSRINDRYTRFGGWALKPYAVLTSSFSEVILMDADSYFFKKPDMLFDDAGYRKTGTLFFYDRTLFSGWETGRNWLSSFLPTMSSLVETTRWWNFKSAHEQESGVVVINKKRSLLGLLATCKMNDKKERDQVTYKHVHGDKETFWVGYEMVQTPYSFIKTYGGVIGGLGDAGDPSMVCGNQLHFGVDRQPLWFNGGLLRDKNQWPDRYLKFTHYAEGNDWEFGTSCIKDTDRIREFTAEEQKIAAKFVELDQLRRKDEEKIQQGLWKPTVHFDKEKEKEGVVEIDPLVGKEVPKEP